jgi:hypothetical protein
LGQSLLVGQDSDKSRTEIWVVPLAAAPRAETGARKIASDPACDLYQSRFSPVSRGIVFEGVRNTPTSLESALYVMTATGRAWMPISRGRHWDDKPRWSPDGRTIYFPTRGLLQRSGNSVSIPPKENRLGSRSA